MEFLKSVAGKILAGVVALAVVAGGISWWTLDAETRSDIVTGTVRILGWRGVVLVLPWATFFAIGWVSRLERNAAGAALSSDSWRPDRRRVLPRPRRARRR
jgi:hypothetical protein